MSESRAGTSARDGRTGSSSAAAGNRGNAPTGPVLLTGDAPLEAEVRRLAAAAGSELTVTAAVEDALTRWAYATVVLVGADLLAVLSSRRPGRRDRVHVVSGGAAPPETFRDALAVSAESVTELPDGGEWLVQLLADAGEGPQTDACTVGVIGGPGGAGASVFAAALAREAALRTPTLLIDADPCGAGVDRICGVEDHEAVSWGGLTATGRLGARALREALPRDGALSVLGFGADAAAPPPLTVAREVVAAARRGFGLLVVDLPRHPTDVAAEFLARCDAAVVVSTLSLTALTETARLRVRLPPLPAMLVTRGRARGVDAETAAEVAGLPLVTVMADQRGVDESIALGLGPVRSRRGPLARAARAVLDTLEPAGR